MNISGAIYTFTYMWKLVKKKKKKRSYFNVSLLTVKREVSDLDFNSKTCLYLLFLYLGLDAKSAVLYNQWLLGELFKQILPLTGQLAKCAFGHEKYAPGKESTQCVKKNSM